MRSLLSILLVCALGAPGLASAAKKAKKGARRGPYGASSRVVRPAEAKGEASLRVRSIDLPQRTVVVEVVGFPRAPAGNLFTFTDDRGRKFIAVGARCEEPFPSGARVCDLETPAGYERHPWVKIELHLHGLTSSTVAAPEEEVERAYEAARALMDSMPAGTAPSVAAPAPGPSPAASAPAAGARPAPSVPAPDGERAEEEEAEGTVAPQR